MYMHCTFFYVHIVISMRVNDGRIASIVCMYLTLWPVCMYICTVKEVSWDEQAPLSCRRSRERERKCEFSWNSSISSCSMNVKIHLLLWDVFFFILFFLLGGEGCPCNTYILIIYIYNSRLSDLEIHLKKKEGNGKGLRLSERSS